MSVYIRYRQYDEKKKVIIYNIYNLILLILFQNDNISVKDSLKHLNAVFTVRLKNNYIMIKDFNLHHSAWSEENIKISSEEFNDLLLNIMQQYIL